MIVTHSEALFARAQAVIPGGVNSPVRAFKGVGGTPRFIRKAWGPWLEDADGHRYLDLIGSWGPMLLGHAHPAIVEAVQRAAENSTSYGAPTELEVEMAEQVVRMVPAVQVVRMVNSGTEACLSALRLARGATGRSKVIKFAGCYHGHADSFLVQAGSGAATLGTPDSPGVTAATAADTLTAHYNDLTSVDALLDAHAASVAAIMVEPVAGNMGCVPPQPGFLQGLRQRCTATGALLIFDEVMTGFRLAPGGAQQLYGVTPDLVTLGKVLGAGLPVGAYGGREDLMRHVAPDGPVYQAGTLSGNPLAMAAGLTLLRLLAADPAVYDRLEQKGQYLAQGMRAALINHGIAFQLHQVGSMLSVHFMQGLLTDFRSAQTQDTQRFARLFHALLAREVYLPPSAYESYFLSDALTEAHLGHIVQAFSEALPAL